jgi:hypothetical protein
MRQEFADKLVQGGVTVGALWKALASLSEMLVSGTLPKSNKGFLEIVQDLVLSQQLSRAT